MKHVPDNLPQYVARRMKYAQHAGGSCAMGEWVNGVTGVSTILDQQQQAELDQVEDKACVHWHVINVMMQRKPPNCQLHAHIRDGRVVFDTREPSVSEEGKEYSRGWYPIPRGTRTAPYVETVGCSMSRSDEQGIGPEAIGTTLDVGADQTSWQSQFVVTPQTADDLPDPEDTAKAHPPTSDAKDVTMANDHFTICRAALEGGKAIPIAGIPAGFTASVLDQKMQEQFNAEVSARLDDIHMVNAQTLAVLLDLRSLVKSRECTLEEVAMVSGVMAHAINTEHVRETGQEEDHGNVFDPQGEEPDGLSFLELALPVPEKVLFGHLYDLYHDNLDRLLAILTTHGWSVEGTEPARVLGQFIKDARGAHSKLLPVLEKLYVAKGDSVLLRICVEFLQAKHSE